VTLNVIVGLLRKRSSEKKGDDADDFAHTAPMLRSITLQQHGTRAGNWRGAVSHNDRLLEGDPQIVRDRLESTANLVRAVDEECLSPGIARKLL